MPEIPRAVATAIARNRDEIHEALREHGLTLNDVAFHIDGPVPADRGVVWDHKLVTLTAPPSGTEKLAASDVVEQVNHETAN